jgi:acetyl-CoA carboxylase biotin carboxylase subunit
MAWGQNRTEAIHRMRRALAELIIVGPATTIPFHQQILEDPRFEAADVHTALVEEWLSENTGTDESPRKGPPTLVSSANGKTPK